MKIIIALTILISLPSFAADHHYEKNVSDGSTIEFKTDENMKMSGKNVVVIKLDENIEIPGDCTGVFILDENIEISGKAKERIMNNPNYLMNRKECKEVKDGVAGLLLMSDGIWEEIKKDPEDKDKWAEVMALSSLASNYSNIYDVWCKGSAHLGMKKMKIKAKKYQKNNKEQKDKKD